MRRGRRLFNSCSGLFPRKGQAAHDNTGQGRPLRKSSTLRGPRLTSWRLQEWVKGSPSGLQGQPRAKPQGNTWGCAHIPETEPGTQARESHREDIWF